MSGPTFSSAASEIARREAAARAAREAQQRRAAEEAARTNAQRQNRQQPQTSPTPSHTAPASSQPSPTTYTGPFAQQPPSPANTAGQPQPGQQSSPTPQPPPADPYASIPADRRGKIDTYANNNARHESGALFWKDNEGGSRVGQALRGNSELGRLSADEQRYLAQKAAESWVSDSDTGATDENVRDALKEVKDDPVARKALVQALASPQLSTMRIHASGGQTASSPEGASNSAAMFDAALGADTRSVLAISQGAESEIAQRLPNIGSLTTRDAVWAALAEPGALPADVQERLTSGLLVTEDKLYTGSATVQDNIAKAVALARRPGDLPQDRAARDVIAQNMRAALADKDTRDMLFNQEVRPDLRMWAMGQIARDDVCVSPATFADGWEGEGVSKAYAQQVTDAYRARGTDPQPLSGEALRNTIGQSMGIPPDQLPADITPEFLQQGVNAKVYSTGGNNDIIDRVAGKITEVGGPEARVTIVPITVTSKEEGAATVPLYRVETEGGPKFVDHNGDIYRDVQHWEETNKLPEGKMTYAKDLDLNNTALTSRNTPGVVDTFGEGFGKVMDVVAIGAGIVAGGAAIFFTGGAATPFVIAGGTAVAGGWGAYRAGSDLYDMSSHGRDIGDLSDPDVRSAWLNLGASTLSIGAAGSAVKIAASGSTVSPWAARAVAGTQIGAEGMDGLSMVDATIQTAQNWDQMSGGQRAGALMNIAFWGGMTVAAGRAGGHGATDSVNFTAMSRRLQTGTAYDVTPNPGMAPGEVGVRYDTTPDGRTTNVRVEYGGTTPPDRATLARHDLAAQQVQAGGGLSDRLKTILGGKQPPVGSEAWEAGIEIRKMQQEAGEVSTALSRTDLTQAERTQLEARQGEITTALGHQSTRLDNWSQGGTGTIGDASRGVSQAAAKGWPDAPAGYTWVAGRDGQTPHLRRLDASNTTKLDYDPVTRTFIERPDVPAGAVMTGHGENDVTWKLDSRGNLTVAEGTLRQYWSGADRSSAETRAQREAAGRGEETDQGGHAVGHRFVLDQGLKNLFPQNANFNMGAYRSFEDEMAGWISRGYDVRVRVEPQRYDANGRPEIVQTKYEVVDPANPDKRIYSRETRFRNQEGQSYDRLSTDDYTRIIKEKG